MCVCIDHRPPLKRVSVEIASQQANDTKHPPTYSPLPGYVARRSATHAHAHGRKPKIKHHSFKGNQAPAAIHRQADTARGRNRQIDRQTAVTLKRREALSDRQTRKTTHPPHTRASASQPYETQQPFCVSFERSFIKNSIHPSIHWHPPAQTPKGPLAACTSEADRNSHIHTYQEGIVELVACSVMFVQRDNRCAALPHTHTHAHTRIGLRRECTITNKRAARLPQTYRAISQSVRLVYTAPSHTRVCPSPSQQPAGVQSLQTNAASSKDRITGTHHSQKQKQTDRQQNTTEHPSK
mmetsp:Transcript_51612/g.129675  ORF Transcript_51612/g.129675 Transcript_51612/m.129675 type:complete len:296 (-) Transcript_51612:57-944(-)